MIVIIGLRVIIGLGLLGVSITPLYQRYYWRLDWSDAMLCGVLVVPITLCVALLWLALCFVAGIPFL
jgi:hypothetical protein